MIVITIIQKYRHRMSMIIQDISVNWDYYSYLKMSHLLYIMQFEEHLHVYIYVFLFSVYLKKKKRSTIESLFK